MNIEVQLPSDVSRLLLAQGKQPTEFELAFVERLTSGRAALPMLPAVAQEALMLVNNPDANIAEFSTLIDKDPPIAARFLSVANSALYSRGRIVTSMQEAVMRLGIYGCRDLLMQVVYASTLTGLKKYQTEVQASFQRSVVSGLTCRAVCAELSVSFREAYLCGLLHDIGESRAYRILSELIEPDIEGEVAVLVRRYHERAGAELARMWKLPDAIAEVCLHHHADEQPATEALRVVRIADLAIEGLEPLSRGEDVNWNELASPEALSALGIDPVGLQAVAKRAADLAAKL